MKKTLLAASLAALPLLAWADGQASIKADSQTNLGSTYTAGTARTLESAYSGAATTAGTIAQQDQQNAQQMYGVWQTDLSNAAYYQSQAASAQAAANSASDQTTAAQYAQQAQDAAAQAAYWSNRAQQDGDAYQAWLDAANQAQSTSSQQTALSNEQGALADQSAQSQQSSYDTLMNTDVPQAQTDTSAQANQSSQTSAQQGLSSVQQQTGVQQGQVQQAASSHSADIGYLAAAAAPQAVMAGMAMGEQTANITAVHAAQAAAACSGWNPGCAAYWWGVNAAAQSTANSLYAAQMAAAPALAVTYIAAGTQAAKQSFDQVQQQIGQMTGVQQQTSASLPTSVGQTPYTVTNDTRYQSVGSSQNQQQVQHAQENTDATWQGAQDWSSGQMYSKQEQAARSIQQTDLSSAVTAPSVGAQQAWQGAADIAGQEADQNATWASWYGDRLQQDEDRQNQSAAAVQADTTGQAQAMNGAAAQSAVTSFNATMQSINAAVAAK
ncbi:hypothetical protein [Thiomonas sp.]|uniref:hypothetical protein n=1 Tax=Thiomonas sp. TaxID=2047785 RepID=UPI00261AFDCE|nr:hypothetical protein [Thiomonas sp.]